MRWLAVAIAVASTAAIARAETHRTIAGSVQLDYLAVPTERHASADVVRRHDRRAVAQDERRLHRATRRRASRCASRATASRPRPAFVDLRAADELSVRIGRLTPEFGSFPQRGDPANHRTNDKPLPYDMGRMLHHVDWNEGILPAPWVDNGIELLGTRFVDGGRVDYAAYILSGPKGAVAMPPTSTSSRRATPTPYYVDNNSEPVVGARLSGTARSRQRRPRRSRSARSAWPATTTPAGQLGFWIAGVDAVASLDGVVLRAEYLVRRTDMAIGTIRRCAGSTVPAPAAGSTITSSSTASTARPRSRSAGSMRSPGSTACSAPATCSPAARCRRARALLRYTVGAALRISENIRLKTSVEYYQFSDFANDVALHLGVATPF